MANVSSNWRNSVIITIHNVKFSFIMMPVDDWPQIESNENAKTTKWNARFRTLIRIKRDNLFRFTACIRPYLFEFSEPFAQHAQTAAHTHTHTFIYMQQCAHKQYSRTILTHEIFMQMLEKSMFDYLIKSPHYGLHFRKPD